MKRSRFLFVALFACLLSWAGPIDQQTAEQTARQFFSKRGGKKAAPLKSVSAKRLMKNATAADTPYYIFNIGDGDGFVIVSGDDAAIPVLGYSDKGTFDWESMPENLREWMKLNEMYIESCRNKTGVVHSPSRVGTPVQAPLLGEIKWGQDTPYNLKCPTYTASGETKHYYVGCVATAATQIMRYHGYPAQGNDTKTYTDTKGCGQTLSADFGNTTYDWANILNTYRGVEATEAQKDAISTLAFHFGVAVDMEYVAGGSGAVSPIVPNAFRHYFRYDSGTTMRKRNYYDTSEWLSIIKSEIDAQRPVYYAASSEDGLGGHAFVCDGYDTEDFVHINWGWYGDYNGYFSVNHLEPAGLGEGGGKGAYNIDQEIITGIQPPTGGTTVYERPLYFSTMMTNNDFGDQFSIGGTVENYDVTPFNGQIAAVLERDGEVLQILKTEDKTINAYTNRRTGYIMGFVVRDVPKTVSSTIANGPAYIRLMFRESATDEWKFLRHGIGRNPQGIPYSNRIKVNVNNGYIETEGVDTPVPDVTILEKVESEFPEVYAKGSIVLPLVLQNNSKHLHLKNVVVRFQSVENDTHYDYENAVNIYDESTESLRFLINLSDEMPAGDYRIVLFEKGFPEHPFTETVASDILTVLPEADYPVMHLTQNVLWQRRDGQIIANQGDMVYFALNSRNYGAAGKVGVILYLVDANDPTKRYMYQQADATLEKGESKTLTFYRQMPVNPGNYLIQVSYLTGDGQIVDDTRSAYYGDTISVGTGTDIRLNGVSVNMPDQVVKGTKLTGSVTFEAPAAYNGYIYVRMRQYTLSSGGILKMERVNLAAGAQYTANISSTITYNVGRYILVYDFGTSSTSGIGSYDKVYKLIDVVDESTGITSVSSADSKPVVFMDGDRICVAVKGDVAVKNIEVFDLSGRCVARRSNGSDVEAGHLRSSVYLVRVTTSDGVFTQKISK